MARNERFVAGFEQRLRLWPGLAERIVGNVDEGKPLVEGISPPLDREEMGIIDGLYDFKHASERKRQIMVETSRTYLREQVEISTLDM